MPELNEQQKKQYNTYRAAGMTPERALSLTTKDADNKYNPALEKGVDNIIFGKGSLTSGLAGAVGEAAFGGFKEVYNDTKEYGAGFAIAKAPLSLVAGVGRGVEKGTGTVLETADDLTNESVSDFLQPTAEAIANSDVTQYLVQKGQELDEKGRGIPSDILDSLNLLGVTAVAKSGTAKTIKTAILSKSDDALKGIVTKGDDAVKSSVSLVDRLKVPAVVKDTVERGRLQLSDIEPSVTDVLRKSNADEVNKYFQSARNATNSNYKQTPLEIVGKRAEEAFDLNKVAINKAATAKKRILEEAGDKAIEAGKLSEIKTSSLNQIGEKFGVDVSDLEDIKQLQGRFSQLDAADEKLLVQFFERLDSLGDTPTLREIDDFVDWSQSQLYKQSKSLSKLEVANDAMVAELKQITGKINGALKEGVGNGYAEVNGRISNLLNLQDEISRALGADARKGAGFVKRLFSPTGGNTREIFEQIKKETGIDLTKEATLAKFAMENVGDTRQRSLLQSLDIAVKEASEVDLAKPGTIVNFFREKADLDGQTLANAFLRELKRNPNYGKSQ